MLEEEALTPRLMRTMRPDLLDEALCELGLPPAAVAVLCKELHMEESSAASVDIEIDCDCCAVDNRDMHSCTRSSANCVSFVRPRLHGSLIPPPPGLPTSSRYLPINLQYPRLSQVQQRPPVYLVKEFLQDAECDLLMQIGLPMLLRSRTDGGVSQVRTSTSVFLDKGVHPCPSIISRVVALTNRSASHMERPQLARYTHGQHYVEHYDTPTQGLDLAQARSSGSGLRVCTVLLYLCTLDEMNGGGTFFPRLGLRVQPTKGCALVFFPATCDGIPDPDSLHAALPVKDLCNVANNKDNVESKDFGQRAVDKWICTIWVHQRPEEDNEPLLGMDGREAVGVLGQALLSQLHAPQTSR